MKIKADFHIHSCSSPECDAFLTPKTIVSRLVQKGVKLAALTDLNTGANLPAFNFHCKQEGIHPLFGIEAQTAEEVRILVIFNDMETAFELGQIWYNLLPNISNLPEEKGFQYYVNEDGSIIGELRKYLAASCPITLQELVEQALQNKALLIPCNIDIFPFFEKISGGPLENFKWDAVLVSSKNHIEACKKKYGISCPILTSSKARLADEIANETVDIDIGNLSMTDSLGLTSIESVKVGLNSVCIKA